MSETRCHHCGTEAELDGCHSCPCPFPDDQCTEHPTPDHRSDAMSHTVTTTRTVTCEYDTEGRLLCETTVTVKQVEDDSQATT